MGFLNSLYYDFLSSCDDEFSLFYLFLSAKESCNESRGAIEETVRSIDPEREREGERRSLACIVHLEKRIEKWPLLLRGADAERSV